MDRTEGQDPETESGSLKSQKHNVLGVLVDAIDCREAVNQVLAAERAGCGFAASALAVHAVMTGLFNAEQRYRLNSLDLTTPDGQPVRWALNLLYGAQLSTPVRGTDLTLRLLSAAAEGKIPVFLYGSRPETLERLIAEAVRRCPGLIVAGSEPSRFKPVSISERKAIAARIARSGARLVFVGLGCPRQETFVYELRKDLMMPLIAVGAAFDYIAGLLPEPPMALRRAGLEWAWRLLHEPRRLWQRYFLLNPMYLAALALQATRMWSPSVRGTCPANREFDA